MLGCRQGGRELRLWVLLLPAGGCLHIPGFGCALRSVLASRCGCLWRRDAWLVAIGLGMLVQTSDHGFRYHRYGQGERSGGSGCGYLLSKARRGGRWHDLGGCHQQRTFVVLRRCDLEDQGICAHHLLWRPA